MVNLSIFDAMDRLWNMNAVSEHISIPVENIYNIGYNKGFLSVFYMDMNRMRESKTLIDKDEMYKFRRCII